MDDYISRKTLIEHLKAHCGGCDNCGEVMHCALDTPAADVAPVQHGHWIEWDEFFGQRTGKKNLGVFCSRCRKYADNEFDYCPNCGAKMNGGCPMTIDEAINVLFPATSRFALNNYREGEECLEACNQACVYGAMALKVLRSCEDDTELAGRLRRIAEELTKEIAEAGHAGES